MIRLTFGKKAMGVGQVFVFIVAALTFALIMIFGYKAVTDFLSKGENVQFYQFKTDLENEIQKLYTEYGSVRVENFYLPGKYRRICFVDLDDKTSSVDDLCAQNQIACSVWAEARERGGYTAADENVFLTPPAPTTIKVRPIKAENGFLCLDVLGGKIQLLMEGRGDHAYLSKP